MANKVIDWNRLKKDFLFLVPGLIGGGLTSYFSFATWPNEVKLLYGLWFLTGFLSAYVVILFTVVIIGTAMNRYLVENEVDE